MGGREINLNSRESHADGAVALINRASAGYEVEFAALAGETLAVLTVPANAVRPVGARKTAHGRRGN